MSKIPRKIEVIARILPCGLCLLIAITANIIPSIPRRKARGKARRLMKEYIFVPGIPRMTKRIGIKYIAIGIIQQVKAAIAQRLLCLFCVVSFTLNIAFLFIVCRIMSLVLLSMSRMQIPI